jgi:DNA sulfur modification protein DndE
MSLADASPPLIRDVVADSNVEMTWKTFTGRDEYAYLRLLMRRNAIEDLYDNDLTKLLHIHVHRGLGILSGLGIRGPEGLAVLAHEAQSP